MTAFCSWSGGKDSMLALHRALDAGHEVGALLAMFDERGERSRSHAIPPQLMRDGKSTLSPQRAMSSAWTPLLPNSPVPQPQNQCQLQ